ncbi:Ornithine/DAP/Arg decarboxylase [Carpediemonas membranifera]|uniref:Ornithine/DAP/Arg decarboxylase n=1 Tax=Carpediemonas membranifera TaxID=201153 RepID=A0A8J6AZB0_9EUKA|nr:Ornithine/DAP/Arg decarboxylase [Carpediemonas membranifera]|eukprot:KAG9389594.1 Ornithine/DAP/Arg decarboxylase [Carpediemonas membranifera]
MPTVHQDEMKPINPSEPMKPAKNTAYEAEFSDLIARANKEGILDEENRWVYFIDEARIIERAKEVKLAFPRTTKHCFALKANPCPAVLKFFVSLGFGLECASIEEVMQALRVPGIDPANVVFDGPCKTAKEISFALEKGVYLNVDNLTELKRVEEAVKSLPEGSSPKVGLRINPQVGAGSIAATSTATKYAKFGIPLQEARSEILEAAKTLPFIVGLHVHVGSGGMHFDTLCAGVKAVVDLADELRASGKALDYVDIGGGFPIEHMASDLAGTLPFEAYYKQLREATGPSLDLYTLVTEFGRALIGHAGTIVSAVEYDREAGGRHIATVHFGADMLVWTTYTHEEMLRVPFATYSKDGALKYIENQYVHDDEADTLATVDLVGPLCFSYDTIAFERKIPTSLVPVAGDHVAMFNTGAYTFAVWSKFNSRASPRIVAIDMDRKMRIIKEKESIDDNLAFWG